MSDIFEKAVHWAPVLTLLISVVSVGLVLYQIRKLIESIQSQTYQRVYELMINIDRFFIDNPKLKPYFYPGTNIESEEPAEKEKLLSVAEMMMDYFDNVYH